MKKFILALLLSAALLAAVQYSLPDKAIAAVPSTDCFANSERLSSHIVDKSVIAALLNQSSWWAKGHMFTPSEVGWLPHSKQLIVSWASVGATQSAESQVIALINQDGSDCHIVARGFGFKASPDGTRIAYLSRESGSLQLYVMNSDGSQHVPITDRAGGLEATFSTVPALFAWSPDSRYIAYIISHIGDMFNYFLPSLHGGSQNDPNAVHVHVFRSGVNSAVVAERGSELRLVRPDGTDDHKLLDEANGTTISSLSWGRTPQTIVYDELHYLSGEDFHAFKSVDVVSSKVTTIVKVPGLQHDYNTILADGGTAILYANDPVFQKFDVVQNLMVAPLKKGKPFTLTNDFKVLDSAVPPQWNNANNSAYFVGIHNSAYWRIYRVRPGELPQIVSRQPEEIRTFALSPDNHQIAWIGRDAVDHLRVRIARANGSDVRTVLELHPFVNTLRTSQVEEFHYRSKDGLELPALLVKPLDYKPGHRYPLILQIHGGGWGSDISLSGTIEPEIGPLEWQYWAAKGYAMVITDYRLSGDYGRAPILNVIKHQDYYERDSDDALGAVNYAIARGIADPKRLGVFGFSYGGVHTNFIITYTHRFRAAISYEGWGDEFMHITDGGYLADDKDCFWQNKGAPWDDPADYLRESSLYHLKGVRTATMFVSGDPALGSEIRQDNEFMYIALRDQGVPTELLQYDGEGHGVSKPGDELDLLHRATSWFDEYLMH